jgi:hypothetical protein
VYAWCLREKVCVSVANTPLPCDQRIHLSGDSRLGLYPPELIELQ